MRYLGRIALALTLVFALAQRASAQVLEQVPEGALVVVKVKNLADTNTKLIAFFKELGVDQVNPDLGDPLAALKKHLKISAGLDEKGELAFVFVDPQISGADEDHSMLILVPVTDYKTFTGNFADAKTEGDFTEVTFASDPDPSYITSWGKFAAISPSKELLGKKPTAGIKLTGLTAKELNDKDAIIYANMAAVKKMALPALKAQRDELVNKVVANLPADKAKYAPAAKAFYNQILNVAEGYLNDANSATYGVSFTKNGIAGTLMTEFEPGTYSGDLVKMTKNTDGSMLAGLPNTKYLAFGGLNVSPEVTTKIVNDFSAPVMKELTALGADGKPIIDYINSATDVTKAMKGATFGMLIPSGMLGQDSIFQVVETINGDSKAIGQAYKSIAANQQEMMNLLAPEAEAGQKTTFTVGAKTIDGVTLDQMQTEFTGDPANPDAAQMQQMMKMMYGPDGVKVFTGAVDANTRIISMGVTDETIQTLITSAKTKDDALAKTEGVKLVSDELPKNKQMVMYLAVDNVLTTGLKYASTMGMNLPINIAPNQPPVGMSIGTEGTAVRVDTFIPTQLVKSITAAVIQFKIQMEGGAQGGGM